MKVSDLLCESSSSSLSSLGVDPAVISAAHKRLGIKHDETYVPITNKKDLMQKMQAGNVIVVVGDAGSSVITRKTQRSVYANRASTYYYSLVGSNGVNIDGNAKEVLTKAGKGKYFASTYGYGEIETPSQRAYDKDDKEKSAQVSLTDRAIREIYGDFIRKAASDAIQRVKQKYMDAMENNNTYELQRYQRAVIALKGIREKGYYTSDWSEWFSTYLQSIDRRSYGFGSVPANYKTMKELVAEPLFKQKYVKFVLDVIREIEGTK
jgi:hypothetical protein